MEVPYPSFVVKEAFRVLKSGGKVAFGSFVKFDNLFNDMTLNVYKYLESNNIKLKDLLNF